MAAESLKEYLVKLGWDIDDKGFRKAIEQMADFESKSESFVGRLNKKLVQAGGIVFSIISSTVAATGKLLDNVSDADRATERFARRMWTTKENARSFLSALDAMDAEYEDIFWMTPEEYQRFMSLKNFGQSLEAPTELNETLKLVRDIQYEFSRLKVIANYGTQWIAYYLGRYLGTDLEEIGTKFRDFNDWLTQHIPQIAEKLARVLSTVIKLGKSGVRFITELVTMLGRLWDKMSDGTKATVGFGAAFLGLLKMGPLGMFIGALFLILTLLEDFYNWKDGKPSAFTGMWEDLSKWKEGLDDSGKLDKFLSTVNDLGDAIWNLLNALGSFGGKTIKWLDDIGALDYALQLLSGTIEGIAGFLQFIADALNVITGNSEKLSDNSVFKFKQEYNDKTGQYETKFDPWGTIGAILGDTAGWASDTFIGSAGQSIADRIGEQIGISGRSRGISSGGYSGIDAISSAQPYVDNRKYDLNMTVQGYEKETAESATQRAAEVVIANVRKIHPVM